MKVAIIEDHSIVGDFLAELCRRDLGYTVVAVARGGAEGLAALREHRPDLVILDISLPDVDGLELAATVLEERPAVRILVFSSLRDGRTLRRVRELGLPGFFDKREQTLEKLRTAVARVADGGTYHSPSFEAGLRELHRDPRAYHRVLSDYEQNILGLIGESRTDEEIAGVLGIQACTVQSRRRDIMGKLNVHTTPKLIRYAIEHGFTRPEHFRRPSTGGEGGGGARVLGP